MPATLLSIEWIAGWSVGRSITGGHFIVNNSVSRYSCADFGNIVGAEQEEICIVVVLGAKIVASDIAVSSPDQTSQLMVVSVSVAAAFT